jgi:hypothetical protein
MHSEQCNDELAEIKHIADRADMIVNGFAFTKDGECIRVVNLDRRRHTATILEDEIIETNMDPIEAQIAIDYYENNKKFMEEWDDIV